MRSFETAVAHYPSTSVATHTATRRTTTHLRCVTKKRTDAPPLRHEDHEDHEETIVSNEGAIVTDDVGRNGVPHLDGTTRRRTSVASRQNDKRRSAPRRNSTTTHLRCVTKTRTSVATQTATTKRRTSVASRNRSNNCFQRRKDCYRRTSVASRTSVATHTATTNRRTFIASRQTYKRNGVCTYIATPRTRTRSPGP